VSEVHRRLGAVAEEPAERMTRLATPEICWAPESGCCCAGSGCLSAAEDALGQRPFRWLVTVCFVKLEDQHQWWKKRGGRELRALLMQHWDPVGVRDAPEAQNEYDTYAAGIIDRLHGGGDAVVIAEYLSWAQERMGLPRPASELQDVAQRITAWYAVAMNKQPAD
jgi:hypothetical protein